MEVYRDLTPWLEVSRGDVCMLQNDPALWTEDMIIQTFRKHGTSTFNIQDAQSFIKDYLSLLCEKELSKA